MHLTRLLEKLDYTATVVNISVWNYMQNIFLYLIDMYSHYFGVKKYSTLWLFILMWQWTSGQLQVINNGYVLSSLLRSCGSGMVIMSTITVHGCFYFPWLFVLSCLSISISSVLVFTLTIIFISPCPACNFSYCFVTCFSVLCTASNWLQNPHIYRIPEFKYRVYYYCSFCQATLLLSREK
jgi:hypothetical protein